MGFLKNLLGTAARGPAPLPSGSFTVDREGEILSSTISSSFSPIYLREISSMVLGTFRDAREASMAVNEVAATYGALNLKARELRGGAIIFLSPRASTRK
jgi:hypothetical protein